MVEKRIDPPGRSSAESRSSAPGKLSNHWNARLEMIKSNHCPSKQGHSPSIVKNVPARRGSRAARSTISGARRSEEHTSELQSLMRISYAVFCLKKKKLHSTNNRKKHQSHQHHKRIAVSTNT